VIESTVDSRQSTACLDAYRLAPELTRRLAPMMKTLDGERLGLARDSGREM
jgi:hypothetical protein